MSVGDTSSQPSSEAEFWIDVGGTFTDCFLRRADGTIRRHKLLSSGVTKGTASPGNNARELVDPARSGDPSRIWLGAQLRFLDTDGNPGQQATVASFDTETGTFGFETTWALPVADGQPYELVFAEDAPLVGMRYLLGLAPADPLPLYVHGVGRWELRVGKPYRLPAEAVSALRNSGATLKE